MAQPEGTLWQGRDPIPTHGHGDRATKGWWPPDPPWPCHHVGRAHRAPSLGVRAMDVHDLCPGDMMVPKMPPCPCTSPPHPAPTQKGASFTVPGAAPGGGGLLQGPVKLDARGNALLLRLFAASPQTAPRSRRVRGRALQAGPPHTLETHRHPWAAACPCLAPACAIVRVPVGAVV